MDDVKQQAREAAAKAIFQHEHSGNSLDNVAAALLEAKAGAYRDCLNHYPHMIRETAKAYERAAAEIRRGE